MIWIERAARPRALDTARGCTHPDVVDTLWKMQNGKCCYCEAKIAERGQSRHVEHFRPRSLYDDQINEWKNLLLACSDCNGKKSKKFPVFPTSKSNRAEDIVWLTKDNKDKYDDDQVVPVLINPCEIDAEKHLTYHLDGPTTSKRFCLILPANDSLFGKYSIQEIGLDRADLLHKYKEHYFKEIVPLIGNLVLALGQRPEDEELVVRKRADLQAGMHGGVFALLTRVVARREGLD